MASLPDLSVHLIPPVGIAIVDQDGNFLEANASFLRLLAYSEQEILRKNFRDLLPPPESEYWSHVLKDLDLNIPLQRTKEFRLFGKKEQLIDAKVGIWFLTSRNGQLQIFLQVEELPANRYEALAEAGVNRALLESQMMLSGFFNNSAISMGIVDVIGEEIFHVIVNPAFLRTCGRTINERRNCREFGVSDSDIAWFRHIYGISKATGQPQTREFSFELSRLRRWYAFTASYLGEAPEGQRYSFAIVEVTDRKNAELAALEASHSKSSFLANMSHEIRTPLHGIVGIVSLLEKLPLSPDHHKYFDALKISSVNLLTIIDDILDFSKIEAGKMDLHTEDFSLSTFINETLLPFEFQAINKNLSVARSIDPDAPQFVHGDRVHIRQILNNLLSNSLKFTDHGRVVFGLRCSRSEGSSQVRLTFTVEDEGIGMSRETLARLFNPFERADASTNNRFAGTGLGLSIAKRLAEQMDGELLVRYSRPGQGSLFEFSVELPIRSDIQSGAREGEQTGQLQGQVLVAEDNPISQMIALTFLGSMGLSCKSVKNGREALEELKRHDFDLVLMDCQMPEMDGYEATWRIRNGAEVRNPNIPIVAMTASAMKDELDRCIAVGMNDCLSKPTTEQDLRTKLAKWLRPNAGLPSPVPALIYKESSSRKLDYPESAFARK